MNLGERIKEARLRKGWTQDELGAQIGVKKQAIYKYEQGLVVNLKQEKLQKLAEALEVSPAYLLGFEEELPSPVIAEHLISFPVIGEIAAGFEHLAAENWEGETVEIPESYLHGQPRSDFFVLTVCGDSMYPLYMNGDRVLIRKQDTLDRSGQIGVIRYDGDKASLKKIEYTPGEDWLRMVPVNPTYMPREIAGSELEKCAIIGVPVLLLRTVNR